MWKLEKTWQDGKALSHPSKVFCFLLDESGGFQAYLNFSQWKWGLLHSEAMRIACFSRLSFVEPSEVARRPPWAGYCLTRGTNANIQYGGSYVQFLPEGLFYCALQMSR